MRKARVYQGRNSETGLTENDLEEILAFIKNEETGKIVTIDSEDGTKVEVVLEQVMGKIGHQGQQSPMTLYLNWIFKKGKSSPDSSGILLDKRYCFVISLKPMEIITLSSNSSKSISLTYV